MECYRDMVIKKSKVIFLYRNKKSFVRTKNFFVRTKIKLCLNKSFVSQDKGYFCSDKNMRRIFQMIEHKNPIFQSSFSIDPSIHPSIPHLYKALFRIQVFGNTYNSALQTHKHFVVNTEKNL